MNPDQQKLNSAAGILGNLVRAIPLGTCFVMIIATFLVIISFFADVYGSLKLSSTDTMHNLFTHIPSLVLNQYVHASLLEYLVCVLAFPFVASGVEQEIGTFQFLWLFQVTGVLTSILYVFIVWIFSFAWNDLGSGAVSGLDISFFTFLSIEALNGRGLYELFSNNRNTIPREYFFIPFLVVSCILMPMKFVIGAIARLVAVVIGSLFYLGLLTPFLLSESAINSLETAGMLRWFYSRPSFLVKPGAVQLPGAYEQQGGERASFISQVSNAIRPENGHYQTINNLQQQPVRSAQEPLTWDEADENDATALLASK